MKILHLSLLLLFFCSLCSLSSHTIAINSPDNDFLAIAKAILQNKNTLSDDPSSRSKFAYWQGWNFTNYDSVRFDSLQGMVRLNSQSYDRSLFCELTLGFFVGNYTDQKEFRVEINSDAKYPQIDQSNGTLIIPNIWIKFQDQDNKTSHPPDIYGDLYFYFVDKTTKKPPKAFDSNNLKTYTYQIRFETFHGTNFISSFFDDSYQVSTRDKIILMIGLIVYLTAAIGSMQRNPDAHNKVSSRSLDFLIFFTMYILFYLGSWFLQMSLSSDLLYYLIPLTLIVLANFIKHIIELKKAKDDFCLVYSYPFIIFLMVWFSPYGLYVGDFSSCFCLLPQVLMKFKGSHDTRRYLTKFEIGNWTCILLWVFYLNFYSNNIFLASPKPALFFIHLIVVLLQFLGLLYLQFEVPKKNKFEVQNSQDEEKLLSVHLL